MKRSIKYNIIGSILLMGCVLLAANDVFCILADKIVAVVNGEIITQRELVQLLIPIYEQYKKEYTGKRLENKMREAENEILNQLIEDKLILSEAKRQGIEATDREIELRLDRIKNQFESEEQFREALSEQNISVSELRDRFKSDIIKSKFIRKEIGGRVVVMPNEVREYYDTNIADFTEPKRAKVYSIVIKKENDRTEEEAKFLIKRIKSLAEKGENFQKLAKEYSEGPNTKEGGDLGFVKKGQMMKEIDDAIFSSAEGSISDIIESPIGFHIFRVTEKIPPRVTNFEACKNDIEDLIYKKKIDKNLEKLLKKLRKNAYISIK